MRIKNFTLMTLALLMMSVVAFAQKAPEPYKFGFKPSDKEYMERIMIAQKQMPQAVTSLTGMAAKYNKAFQRSFTGKGIAKAKNNVQSRRTSLQAPSEGATELTFYLQQGEFYVYTGSWSDYTEEMPSVTVAFDTNNLTQVWVKGLSYYFPDTWVEGNFDTSAMTITLPTGQLLGSDEGDNIYFMGISSFEPLTEADVVFAIDMENMICTNEDIYVCEANAASISDANFGGFYTQWVPPMVYSATAPEPDVVVEVPTGLVTNDWLFEAQKGVFDNDGNLTGFADYSANVTVGFDGDDVYVQGLCSYIPDAWVKGTKSGNQVVFPTGQYFGAYSYFGSSYKMYFVGLGDDGLSDVTMTLNTEGNQLSTEDWILINGKKSSINIYTLYGDPITLTEIPDVAATPATPEVTDFATNGSYGWVVSFDIPVEDTNGNPIISSKLYYKIYSDTEHEVSALTFTPTTHSELTADMTEIPYGFTENWDFYAKYVYLNDLYSSSWNKIGIQSIYYGGGERKESEIFWFVITPYSHEVTFVAANDLSIQNGKATVQVDGKKATVDADGKLAVPETYTVTLTAASGYKFVSVTSTGATVELDQNGFVASFEMPAEDITVNYEMRELGSEIDFATTGEYTIQDGQATVTVNGDDVTGNIDETGTLLDVAKDATVTITAEPGFKLTNVTASYEEKSAGGVAGSVTIGDLEGATNNSYLPMNSLYNYSYTQQIYTADEIGQAGTINAITVWMYGKENLPDRLYDIYMVETSKEKFDSKTDWIPVTASDMVYSGTVTVHNTEAEAYTFTLDTPFEYSGTGNLVVCFLNKTGEWSSGLNGMVFGENTDPVRSIYFRNDETLPDPTSPTITATDITYARNVMQFDFAGGGGASGELTVYDGTTTNGYVPVYGFYADAYNKCEFVMPASVLTGMSGSNISAMKFYTSESDVNWGDAQFQVFMKEVTDETISAFSGPGTVVYEGALSIANGEMNVEFTTPYTYNGGNLLIGFYQPVTGKYVSAHFYGETVTGASISGYSYSSIDAITENQRNFLPKTTFTYGGSGGSATDLDVNLAADGNSASFTLPGSNGIITVNYELVRLGYSINVPADTYITYYTDKDITVYDNDVELLTVTAVSATEATVTPLTVVAAETPMLIHNSSSADKTLWIVPTEETHDKPAADVVTVAPEFKGTLTAKEFTDADMAAKDHYVCTGKSFVWVRNAGSIGANKCWLEVDKTTTQGAPSLIIGYGNGNDATGIAPVTGKTGAENGQWYDLNGRKLNAAPTQKGVYVINGKKVVIK